MSKKILVTGGAGYIGSHTIIEILNRTDYDVVSIDNFSNSSPESYERIEAITGKKIESYDIDLCDRDATMEVLSKLNNLAGVIHFAAFKLVPESVANPFKYYSNNIDSLLNLLEACKKYSISNFIFSSSCSVYGNINQLPVLESTPFNRAESPYAYTKQIGERILEDFCQIDPAFSCIALRYFNPVGAHVSGLIGEDPINPPTSLVPVITKTAVGKIKQMHVHGIDYDTRDGSCIRDYIHVSDVAEAHIEALKLLIDSDSKKISGNHLVLNIGTGRGVSVLEAIYAFEKASGTKLNYVTGPRREGDVESIYSDTSLSEKILNWKPKFDIEVMMSSAWKWEQHLSKQL